MPIAIADGVYQSVAVVGDVAFVGHNRRGIDLVDLNLRRKTGRVAGQVVADAMTSMGRKVVACGLRDDAPIDPMSLFTDVPADRRYVLTVIDAATKKVEGEVKLGLERLLSSRPPGFHDLPDLSCRFDASAKVMVVTFSGDELGQRQVAFKMPAVGASLDFENIPGAITTNLSTGSEDTLKASASSEHGITYAAGGHGLRRLAPSATRATALRSEGREWMADLAIRNGSIYAVDHDGGLVIAEDATGKTVERVEIPDLLHAITLTPTHVVVVGRGGIFLAKDRWGR